MGRNGYDQIKFGTFDFKTQRWTDLFIDAADNHIVSLDGMYLYYTTIGVGMEPPVKRFRFADHQIETITSEGDLRLWGYIGVAPDGSPVSSRDIGTQEIYALNVRWP